MDLQQTLNLAGNGDAAAEQQLTETVYAELQQIAQARMRGERMGHTLQPTALVHEAVVRLCAGQELKAANRQHLIALSSRAMQRVLVDHARRRGAEVRGGGRKRIPLEDIHPAAPSTHEWSAELATSLEALGRVDARKAQVAQMRIMGGMAMLEIAAVLGMSINTIDRDWQVAKQWLLQALALESSEPSES
jgi:RNA polymerase sigma factor (TIGR02999 family)